MRLLLSLALLHQSSAQFYHQVCGANYTDASENCLTNNGCPTGDGCAEDETCFSLPDELCQSKDETWSPTPSPNVTKNVTETFEAADATDANVTATSNVTDFASNVTDFASEAQDSSGSIAAFDLPTAAPSSTTTAAAIEPAVEAAVAPHTFVCGVDYGDAAANCTTNLACPNGDGCGDLTCYAIPAESCVVVETAAVVGNETAAIAGNETADAVEATADAFDAVEPSIVPTPSPNTVSANTTVPTPAPTPNDRFCGANYTDAEAHCSDERACPGGFECSSGQTCFAGVSCPVPTPEPTESPTANRRFCGTNYTDAADSCSFERACPLGIECGEGRECFAGIACAATSAAPSLSPTLSPTVSFMPTDNSTGAPSVVNTQFCGTNYTDALASCSEVRACPLGTECGDGMACFSGIVCPVKNVTMEPTPAPTANTHYCGANWTDATESCSEERACPSGFGCPDGMTCYTGVVCSASKGEADANSTEANTTAFEAANVTALEEAVDATAVQSNATEVQSNATEVKTNATEVETNATKVETNATDVESNATDVNATQSNATEVNATDANVTGAPAAAPVVIQSFCGANYTDAEAQCSLDTACPGGFECGPGETCFANIMCSIPEGSTLSPTPASSTSTSPTLRGSVSPTNVNMYYCGTSPKDAADNCATNTPCPNGLASSCSEGQTCFVIDQVCAKPSGSPTAAVTAPPTKDLSNITSFCGTNWNDAQENCYTAAPCPSGSSEDCPDQLGCFEGILDCKAPNFTAGGFYNDFDQEKTESASGSGGSDMNSWNFGSTPGYVKSSSSVSGSSAALVVAGVLAFML